MSDKSTIFYRGNTAVSVDFSAEEISSDGAIVLLEKIEREHKLLRYYSSYIPDHRHPLLITHTIEKLLKQRVYMLMQGYQDANDVLFTKIYFENSSHSKGYCLLKSTTAWDSYALSWEIACFFPKNEENNSKGILKSRANHSNIRQNQNTFKILVPMNNAG